MSGFFKRTNYISSDIFYIWFFSLMDLSV